MRVNNLNFDTSGCIVKRKLNAVPMNTNRVSSSYSPMSSGSVSNTGFLLWVNQIQCRISLHKSVSDKMSTETAAPKLQEWTLIWSTKNKIPTSSCNLNCVSCVRIICLFLLLNFRSFSTILPAVCKLELEIATAAKILHLTSFRRRTSILLVWLN